MFESHAKIMLSSWGGNESLGYHIVELYTKIVLLNGCNSHVVNKQQVTRLDKWSG